MNLNLQFNETNQQVSPEFKDVSYFSSGEGGTPDHSKLINREAADQHPMSAITGLEDALDGKQEAGNYLTKESDPTVPEWAKQPQKPTYTAQEVGALPATTRIPSTAADVNAEPSGAVSQHNVSDAAHSDIRLLIQGLSERLSALADSDDTTLDQLSEIVAYIKSNRDLISAITTSKVNVADIVDNLTTSVVNKPLSAAQGVALKALIDAITVPTALSELTDDTTHRVVTDVEKAVWNAKSNFTGSYNDLTDKPTIPGAYTLPIASSTALGGVQPADKTDAMTQEVGVDENGGLWTAPGGNNPEWVLLDSVTLEEEVVSMELDISGGYNELYAYIEIEGTETNTASAGNVAMKAWGHDVVSTGNFAPQLSGTNRNAFVRLSRTPNFIFAMTGNYNSRPGNYANNANSVVFGCRPLESAPEFVDTIKVNAFTKYYGVGTKFMVWGMK